MCGFCSDSRVAVLIAALLLIGGAITRHARTHSQPAPVVYSRR
jgi:hypothetical protein